MEKKCNETQNFIVSVSFSDEATFMLNGHVSRHNCRYWSNHNPNWMSESYMQRPQIENFWVGVNDCKIVGSFVINESFTSDQISTHYGSSKTGATENYYVQAATLSRCTRITVRTSLITGICAGDIELYEVNSGKPSWEQREKFVIDDRIRLKIPFAGQYLSWEIVFNCSLPQHPPDFDINDENFLNTISIDVMEECVPSLLNWDFRDNRALFNVISELRVLYLKYQVELMDMQNNHCTFQYTSLLNKAKINSEDIEVFVSGSTVYFLVNLNINLSPFDLPKEEHYYKIALATSFSPHMTTPRLIMTPDFEDLIISNVQFPSFIKDDDSFGDYILNIIERIEDEIMTTFLSRETKRKLFFFELLGRFGMKSVLDYDIMKHTHANFLLSRNGFYYILRVTIPKEFPTQSPTYKFQSVYNLDRGEPLTHSITGVPFNVSWTVNFMVEKLWKFIEGSNEVMQFQECSMKLFKLSEKKS